MGNKSFEPAAGPSRKLTDEESQSRKERMDSIHDAIALEMLCRRWRVEPDRLRQLRNAFYKRHQAVGEALQPLPQAQRATFGGDAAFPSLELPHRPDPRPHGA